MENIEQEQMIRIESKIDNILKYIMKSDYCNLKKVSSNKSENRKAVNKILYSLPDLERFSEIQDITDKDLEYITDTYIESLMGTKKVININEYMVFREEIKEKVKTKIFVNRIHKVLDSYLDLETNTKLNFSKQYNIESLNMKKAIIRRVYGYKLEEGEVKVKSREEFAEQVGYTPRSIYMYQNELLDDLSPALLGVKGLIL